MNSFKLLENDGEHIYHTRASENVQRKLEGTFGSFRLIGHIVDVYLPRMVDAVMALAGGDHADSQTNPPHAPTSGTSSPPAGPTGLPGAGRE